MMKINVIQPRESAGENFQFKFITSAENIDVNNIFVDCSDIAITGSIVNTGCAYAVEGLIRFSSKYQCDRCLESYVLSQEIELSEEYQDDKDIEKEDAIEFSGDEIDISDVVRETILLAQPLNNICSPECRGLCLKCGANLNETDCNCDRHVMDPRLAALQDFFYL